MHSFIIKILFTIIVVLTLLVISMMTGLVSAIMDQTRVFEEAAPLEIIAKTI